MRSAFRDVALRVAASRWVFPCPVGAWMNTGAMAFQILGMNATVRRISQV